MSKAYKPSLSICIVAYNSTHDELQAVFTSLLRAVQNLQLEIPHSRIDIYLVDNSETIENSLQSFTESLAALAEPNTAIHVVQGHGNIGFGSGHNLVISKIESQYHLILNPDVILEPNSLLEGISYLEQHQDTAIVSPYATGFDDKKQYLCKTYPALFTFLVRGFVPATCKFLFEKRLAKFEMRHLSESEPTTGIPIVSGCFMLTRTGILKKAGGFNENYFLYFEDFDLSLRIGTIADIAYLPMMRIRHTGGHTAKKGRKHWLMFLRSARYFFNSHGWQLYKQS